ncbi:hypothetical protein DCCM_3073 [Desulfocucumis palustris]|uniref:TadE-like protein n=1 Tax=Desulfocucumis palustris TaxID=1898651 RepID=A0A2L2XCW3_9FIRM|nr:hypothetical protein [Desulfocucumis palustris]GBF33962.1 hypothetical protein DCCM_3073 [Desulfocucumis palustris]
MAGKDLKMIARNERGAVLLELVITSMIILVIWTGMCNTALLFKDKLAVIAVAREAGREAAATGNLSRGEQKGREMMDITKIRDKAEINVYWYESPYLAAEVTCRSPLVLPGMGALLGHPWEKEITLKTTKIFRAEP